MGASLLELSSCRQEFEDLFFASGSMRIDINRFSRL
jgi:hypothetical protein